MAKFFSSKLKSVEEIKDAVRTLSFFSLLSVYFYLGSYRKYLSMSLLTNRYHVASVTHLFPDHLTFRATKHENLRNLRHSVLTQSAEKDDREPKQVRFSQRNSFI